MKASEFMKKYEKEHGTLPEEEDHSLEANAKRRAKNPSHLNVGTPYDWEDLERYQEELDRMDREGPGAPDK